jgi:hypothetical protein
MTAIFEEYSASDTPDIIHFTYQSGLTGIEMMEGRYNLSTRKGYIDMLEVSPTGMGYGRRAEEALEEYLRSKGITKVYGNSVDSAVDFWESVGYKVGKPDEELYYPIAKKLIRIKKGLAGTSHREAILIPTVFRGAR